MPYCRHCGKELPSDARFCPGCGREVAVQGGPLPPGFFPSPSEEEFAAFVERNRAYYLRQFRRFEVLGGAFALTWNWAAFFLGPIWMLYRKLYLWAMITFILEWIPGLNLLVWIAVGCTANYLYYRHTRARILEWKSYHPGASPSLLTQEGGVSPQAALFGIVLWLLIFIGGMCLALTKSLFFCSDC